MWNTKHLNFKIARSFSGHGHWSTEFCPSVSWWTEQTVQTDGGRNSPPLNGSKRISTNSNGHQRISTDLNGFRRTPTTGGSQRISTDTGGFHWCPSESFKIRRGRTVSPSVRPVRPSTYARIYLSVGPISMTPFFNLLVDPLYEIWTKMHHLSPFYE